MAYAFGDVVVAAGIAAFAAIVVALLNLLNVRAVKHIAEPINERLTTIQVNTDGRLDELIKLNLAQRAATVAGVELPADVRDHLAAVVGDVVVAPTVHPLIPPVDRGAVTESEAHTTTEGSHDVDVEQ